MLSKSGSGAAAIPAEWQHARRVLAVRMDNIGDVVMLGPALRTIKEALPQANLTLMASPGGAQAATLLPWVDDVITWRAVWQDISNGKGPGAIGLDPARERQFVEMLAARKFDAAVIFTSFSQSPYPPAYACYLAGIPIRLGHSKEFGGYVLSHWARPPADSGHQVDRNLSLLEFAGFSVGDRSLELHVPEAAQAQADALLVEQGIEPGSPFIVLAPGASCQARRYDMQRFADAARWLSRRSGLPLVIIGSQREAHTLEPVTALAVSAEAGSSKTGEPDTGIRSLVGKTSVAELAGIICRSALALANNSATLHLADAFQVPQVVLYSGTEYESQWCPRRSDHRLLRRETACSPCYSFHCPYHMECLDIPAAEVVEAAMSLLAGEPGPKSEEMRGI